MYIPPSMPKNSYDEISLRDFGEQEIPLENDINVLKEYNIENKEFLLGVKKERKNKALVLVRKTDIGFKNVVKSWFGWGPLAHIDYNLTNVSSYLLKFNFRVYKNGGNDSQKACYHRVCELAAKGLSRRYPKANIRRGDSIYWNTPEVALWVKNSETKIITESKFPSSDATFEEKERIYKVYLNPATKAEHLLLMERFCDLHSHRNAVRALAVKLPGNDYQLVDLDAKIDETNISLIHPIGTYMVLNKSLESLKDVTEQFIKDE